MSRQTLYRCVCGAELAVEPGARAACLACGRSLVAPRAGEASAAETRVLGGEGARTSSNAGVAGPAAQESAGTCLTGAVFDHFEVLEEIGRGGMGTVYRALDRSLERYVALKVLTNEVVLKDAAVLEAFVHEARAQARVNHPGIATIHYVGRVRGMAYFAMEIVSGTDLEARLKNGRLPFAQVVDVGIQVVAALKEAHARGVIHRDIKPGNIILTESGRVKLTDFGLSKTDRGGLQITGKHTLVGTPLYVAPEQARGEATDCRTDIYSLGATLHHLVYAQPPFAGNSYLEVVSKHLHEPLRVPPPPASDVPHAFRPLLERMLAKEPAARFQSYDALEAALAALRPEARVVASFGRRAAAALLDYLLLFAALAVATWISAAIAAELTDAANVSLPAAVASGIVAALVAGLVLAQMLWRTTPGKVFGKLRIARLDGSRPGRLRLGLRAVLQFLPLVVGAAAGAVGLIPTGIEVPALAALSGVDFLWALTNRNRRTLHDLALGTWVLEKV